MILYQGSAKPLYEQLKDIIIQKIESGELKPGICMPGERQLAETYNVSRVTIRQAIGELVNDGFLTRHHGKGTFIASRKLVHNLGRLIGVAEELAQENLTVDCKVICKEFGQSTVEIQRNLGLGSGDNVYKITRLMITQGAPLVVNDTYMPENVGYIVDAFDLSHDIIYPIIERSGYKLSYAEQRISADKASPDEAKLLEYKVGAPVLVMKRTTYVESGQAITFERSVYRPDRYEYRIDLKRSLT